jgi:hypothetical protein
MNHMAGIRPAANATVPVMALKAFQSRHLSTGRNIDPLLATHGHLMNHMVIPGGLLTQRSP